MLAAFIGTTLAFAVWGAPSPSPIVTLASAGAPTTVTTASVGEQASSSTTLGPTTTSSPSPNTLTTGGTDNAFCQAAKNYVARLHTLAVSLTDRARARDLLAGAPAAAQLVTSAPAEVRADVVLLTEAVTDFRARFEGAGYDITKLPPDALTALQRPNVLRAIAGIETWAQRAC